jgi:hypothetical protein
LVDFLSAGLFDERQSASSAKRNNSDCRIALQFGEVILIYCYIGYYAANLE